MTSTSDRFGLSVALTTPFLSDGALDLPRLAAHARWCLSQGCASVTAFGTTGEGASIGMADRHAIFGALKAAGLDFRREIVGGVAASCLEDALAQTRMILEAGSRAVLLAPPFYFKSVEEDGLFAWFAALFEALGASLRDIILYNIPSVTAVTISPSLVARLRQAFPDAVTGVKDSSGSWESAQGFLGAHRDLAILIGDERQLGPAVALGAQGAISGLANIWPEKLLAVIARGEADAGVSAIVDAVLTHPVIPAVKSLVADRTGDPAWRHVRPPLLALPEADAERLGQSVAALARV